MTPRTHILNILTTLIAIAFATPHARGPNSTTISTDSSGAYQISYAPNWPTCGNDNTFTTLHLTTTIPVAVQPDCDNVINSLCVAASLTTNTTTLGHSNGTCEGYILYNTDLQIGTRDQFSYGSCVSLFQGITEMCMLLGDGSEYASLGHQFGVQNVYFNQRVLPRWSGSEKWNQLPGIMIGQAGMFQDLGIVFSTLAWETRYTHDGR